MLKKKKILFHPFFPPKFLSPLFATSVLFSLFILCISVSPSALSSLQTQTPPNINVNITHHPPSLKLNRFTLTHLHCRSFTRRLISDPSPNPFTDSPSPSTDLIRHISKSLYRFTLTLNRFIQTHLQIPLPPISKSLYRFTFTLNQFNQTHLQIPLLIHPHPHSSHKPNTLDSTHLTLHSITLSSN